MRRRGSRPIGLTLPMATILGYRHSPHNGMPASYDVRKTSTQSCAFRLPDTARHCVPVRQDRVLRPKAAGRGEGFGSNAKGSGIARDGPGRDQKKESSGPTIEPNKLLKIFFETEDKGVVAEQYSTSLSEKFFIVLDSFMGLASKEGNTNVTAALKQTLEAAMKVKQRSLRPEIQLLNNLLADPSFADRAVRLSSEEASKTLKMNDGYFFELLKMMTNDASRAAKNDYSSLTLDRLTSIEKECTARLQSTLD